MEVATVRTTYVDEVRRTGCHDALRLTRSLDVPQDRQAEVDKTKIVYGADLGAAPDDEGNAEESSQNFSARSVKAGHRVSVIS